MSVFHFRQNSPFAMFDVFGESEEERLTANAATYYSTAHMSCEICGWMQAAVYDPLLMDYQSFATWPMIYPGTQTMSESDRKDLEQCWIDSENGLYG
ncbi:MAG: hypothetical protein EBY29_15780, partial [Planctomycetes bacterium]|nr:hypothetical protein [Planctomycetota bacterium]